MRNPPTHVAIETPPVGFAKMLNPPHDSINPPRLLSSTYFPAGGAGGLAGGALGVVSQAGVSGEEAHAIAECLRRGATLVTARVPDTDRTRYEAILDRGAINVRARVVVYREAGWTSHDPNAGPYASEEIERERERHARR